MKKAIKLFSLSIFIVCLLPCFQMCSDNSIIKRECESEVLVDSTLSVEIIKLKNDSLKELTQEKRNVQLKIARKQWTFNAYELGFSGFREFETEDFKDWTFYPMLCFTVFIVLSVFVLFFSFREYLTKVYKFSLLNLGFLICSMLIFIVKGSIDISQIRYGYYILICNVLILIILSKRETNRNSRYPPLQEIADSAYQGQ